MLYEAVELYDQEQSYPPSPNLLEDLLLLWRAISHSVDESEVGDELIQRHIDALNGLLGRGPV